MPLGCGKHVGAHARPLSRTAVALPPFELLRCNSEYCPPQKLSPRTLFTSEYCPPGHYSLVNNVPLGQYSLVNIVPLGE